jgi:hypothetical protein
MARIKQQQGVTSEEFQKLLIATADLPFIRQTRGPTHYLLDVMETTLNLHIQEPVVVNALNYFQKRHNQSVSATQQVQTQCIHTHAELQMALDRFADTKEGNKEASQYLWGNYHWTRVALLRRFMEFLTSINVADQPSLHAWAKAADFERDFQGKVKGLGIAVFHWLLLRCGVSTIKPDIWVINFAKRILGKRISEKLLVKAFAEIAPLVGESLETIDLTIWHFEKMAMATTDVPQLRIVWWHLLKQQLATQLLADPSRTAWQLELDDKSQLRYADAGLTISKCLRLNQPGNEASLKETIVLQQSVWHEGFELEMLVKLDSALPPNAFEQFNAKLNQENLEWEVSNEPALEIKIDEQVDLLMPPDTTLFELTELAVTTAQCVLIVITQLETFSITAKHIGEHITLPDAHPEKTQCRYVSPIQHS